MTLYLYDVIFFFRGPYLISIHRSPPFLAPSSAVIFPPSFLAFLLLMMSFSLFDVEEEDGEEEKEENEEEEEEEVEHLFWIIFIMVR